LQRFNLISSPVFAVRMISRVLVVVFAVCLVLARSAFGQPSLTGVTPQGLLPGQAVQVTVRGENLAPPIRLWAPGAIAIEEIKVAEDGKSLTCRMTADAGSPIRVVGLLAANASGVSDPILMMVDDLGSVADNGSNHSITEAQSVTASTSVDGVFDGPESDFYLVRLNLGQRIAVEAVVQRLASSLDPILRLLDTHGNEIAIADDNLGVGADCRLTFQAHAEGEYLIELRDNRYRQGGKYRLRIGDFPVFTSPYPLGGRLGATTQFQFTGCQSDEALSLIKRLPTNLVEDRLAISVKRQDGVSSAMSQIAVSNLPERIEIEPNDQSEVATSVTVPCAVSGVLNSQKDVDYFEFALAKGQRIDCVGDSRRYGSPSLVFMQLFDAQGGSVAQTSVNDADDAQLSYTAPDNGIYQLAVRDLIYRGGESFAYRVAVRSGADYSLTLKHADKTTCRYPVSRADRAIGLTVSVQRRGYSGPIRLVTSEPNDAFTLYNQNIPSGTNELRMFAVLAADTEEGEFWALRFVGIAQVDGREVRRAVMTEATVRSTVPQLAYAYPWQDGLFTVGVTGAADPFFGMTCEPAEHILVRGGQLQIPLKLERKNEEFKGSVSVFAEQLPESCQAEIKSDKDIYTVTVSCREDAPENDASLRLVMIGEHSGRTQTFVQDVVLQIVPPESTTVAKDSVQNAD